MYKITFFDGVSIKTKTIDKAYLYHVGRMIMSVITKDGELQPGEYKNIAFKVEKLSAEMQKAKVEKITTDLKKAQEIADKTAVTLRQPNQ